VKIDHFTLLEYLILQLLIMRWEYLIRKFENLIMQFITKTGSRGGGVLVAVDESIPSSLIDSPPNLEIIVVHAAGANISYYSVYSLHPTQLQ